MAKARIRAQHLGAGFVPEPSSQITIGDCIAAYRARPGGLHPFDLARLEVLEQEMAGITISSVREAWGTWLRGRGHGLSPSTVARWRSTLRAALAYGAEEFGVTVPPIRAVRGAEVERIAYVTPEQEQRLLAAYSPWAAPVMR